MKIGVNGLEDIQLDKSTFMVTGTYKNQGFELYDYKDDESIHIGCAKSFPVAEFVSELHQMVINYIDKQI